MWLWIIVAAVVIGGIWGFFESGGQIKEAIASALGAGCMAGSCLLQILLPVLLFVFFVWLAKVIFF